MAMHIWNGSVWKAVNTDSDGAIYANGLQYWDGSNWIYAYNAKIWNGSAWKGFLDNVQLFDQSIWTQSTPFGSEIAVFNISSDGNAYGNYSLINQWNMNPDNSNQYQVYMEQYGGSEPVYGASLNTWLDLGPAANREWYIAPLDGNGTAFTTVSIRHKITQELLTQADIYLSVSENEIPI